MKFFAKMGIFLSYQADSSRFPIKQNPEAGGGDPLSTLDRLQDEQGERASRCSKPWFARLNRCAIRPNVIIMLNRPEIQRAGNHYPG